MYIKVTCRNRPDCIVMLCQDCTTKKWCYVDLTTEHVCACRFDTIDDALADIKKRAEVASFSVINNPFAPYLTENAMPSLISRNSNVVDMFRENEEMEKLRKN